MTDEDLDQGDFDRAMLQMKSQDDSYSLCLEHTQVEHLSM